MASVLPPSQAFSCLGPRRSVRVCGRERNCGKGEIMFRFSRAPVLPGPGPKTPVEEVGVSAKYHECHVNMTNLEAVAAAVVKSKALYYITL